jgi:hypothetical protein
MFQQDDKNEEEEINRRRRRRNWKRGKLSCHFSYYYLLANEKLIFGRKLSSVG